MAEFSRTIDTLTITAVAGVVAVHAGSRGEATLTPGKASEVAAALTEAARVAVQQKKDEAEAARRFADAGGPKHEEMW